jgi:glycosyltransferase involved in cell wall biosynthesis
MENLFIKSGLDKRAIHHVPYGIDTEPLKKGINKTESQDIRFAFIGALAEHKGPDLLIKAFMDLPPDSKASLKLFGDLEQFPEYGQLLKRLVENDSPMARKISFEGTFPNDQIGDIFQNIDVLVVPSRWYENTPLVIQSALAAKTPVIATNLGGMSEIIIHKINGLLFEVDNKESLQKQLLDIILTDSMLTMLKENIKPERTISKMVDDLEAIYAGIKNLAISARP